MFSSLPQPSYMPCPECGESVAVELHGSHLCDRGRLADYQLFHLRDEVESLEREIEAFLTSPLGRFELWDAERRRCAD